MTNEKRSEEYNGWTNWETWNVNLWLNTECQEDLQNCLTEEEIKELWQVILDHGAGDTLSVHRVDWGEILTGVLNSK